MESRRQLYTPRYSLLRAITKTVQFPAWAGADTSAQIAETLVPEVSALCILALTKRDRLLTYHGSAGTERGFADERNPRS